MGPGEAPLTDSLRDMQADALRLIALLLALPGYIGLFLLVFPMTGSEAPPAAWLGCGLLLLTLALSYWLRQRFLRLSAGLLVGGLLLTIVCALLAFRSVHLTYLFILPVIFTSVLLGRRAVFVVAALASLVGATLGVRYLGLGFSSLELWLPIAVIAFTAIAAWLAVRNVYTALAWVWNRYEQADRNERLAREGQAELRRVLKALDEATYRLERANFMLTFARDQAQEAHRLKQQFAQTISHELRTPLNLIVGFTELMGQSPEYYRMQYSPTFVRDLSIVHRNACHLQDLVNDVLDLARIEAARMSLTPEAVDPQALVQEAVNTVRSLVETRGLYLHTEIEPQLPQLWLDPTRIRQVLFNLFKNAARYTERGGVTVSARCQADQVVFAVADTGVGIPPEQMPRLFEEFQQIDGTTRRPHEGVGLGLAISKRFVELHGGRIWAESQVGRGSTFYVSLPVQRRDAIAIAGAVLPFQPAPVKPTDVRILLAVTRSPAAAGLLTRYGHGFRAVIVQDLDQGRQMARQLLPQAVVIDTALEAVDGSSLRQLAQDWALPHTPFIACPLPGEEPLRRRLHVEGYLVKPVSRASLWDVLRRLGEGIDRVLVVDDDPDFARLMERLLDSPLRRYQVTTAHSGREGLDLLRSQEPDLVLLDLVLPDMHGTHVIDCIRADPMRRHLPIVVVTAQEEIDTLETLSGSALIAKGSGLSPAEVMQWIENVMHET